MISQYLTCCVSHTLHHGCFRTQVPEFPQPPLALLAPQYGGQDRRDGPQERGTRPRASFVLLEALAARQPPYPFILEDFLPFDWNQESSFHLATLQAGFLLVRFHLAFALQSLVCLEEDIPSNPRVLGWPSSPQCPLMMHHDKAPRLMVHPREPRLCQP